MQRSVIKELFNFFVAPVGGWQYLDLAVDLSRRRTRRHTGLSLDTTSYILLTTSHVTCFLLSTSYPPPTTDSLLPRLGVGMEAEGTRVHLARLHLAGGGGDLPRGAESVRAAPAKTLT